MKKLALLIALICASNQLFSMENNNNSSSKQLIDLRKRQSLSPHQKSLVAGIDTLRPNRVTESLAYLLIGLPDKPVCPDKAKFQQTTQTTKIKGDSALLMLFKKTENIKHQQTTETVTVTDNAEYKKACDDYSLQCTFFNYELKIAADFQSSLDPLKADNLRSLYSQYNKEKRDIKVNRNNNQLFLKEAQQTAQIVKKEQEAEFEQNARGAGLKNWMRWYKAGMGLSAVLGVASLGIWNSHSAPAEQKLSSLLGMAAAAWGGIQSFLSLRNHITYYQNRVDLAEKNITILKNFNAFDFENNSTKSQYSNKNNNNNNNFGAGNQPEYEICSPEKNNGGSSSDSDSSEGESSKSSTSSESSSSGNDSDSDSE